MAAGGADWVVAMDAHPADGGNAGYDTIPTNAGAKKILTRDGGLIAAGKQLKLPVMRGI